MDIRLPANTNIVPTQSKTGDSGLSLKLNQVLEAKIVDTQIMLDTLTMKIDDRTVTAQAKLPIALQAGQTLQLQVVKLLPIPEFKIVSPLADNSAPGTPVAATAESLQLKLVTESPSQTTSLPSVSPQPRPPVLSLGQSIPATIVNVKDDNLTLQLTAQDKPPTQPVLLTLNSKQLATGSGTGVLSTTGPDTGSILKAGTPVMLSAVQEAGRPKFTLVPAAEEPVQVIRQSLKTLLPIQDSPTPLLQHIQNALPHLQANPTVAESLKHLAQEILQSLPDKALLSDPVQLRQIVNQSGLFLESKLLALFSGRIDVPLQGDFKLKLGQLVQLLHQVLDNPPPSANRDLLDLLKDTLQKAQATLAGLALDQLNSLPRDESPKQVWTLQLPFFHDKAADSLQIEIERDKAGNDGDSEQNWAVNVIITPPGLDTIHCRISCYDGSVNTRFWSENSRTVDKINAHLDYLKTQFEKNGLTSGFMEAYQGKPVASDSLRKPPFNLLSEEV